MITSKRPANATAANVAMAYSAVAMPTSGLNRTACHRTITAASNRRLRSSAHARALPPHRTTRRGTTRLILTLASFTMGRWMRPQIQHAEVDRATWGEPGAMRGELTPRTSGDKPDHCSGALWQDPFAILRSGTADNARQATDLAVGLANQAFAGTLTPRTPGGSIDRFLQEIAVLARQGGFLVGPVRASDDFALLQCEENNVVVTMCAIAEAAAHHGLAVLDPERQLLLDMAGALPIVLETDGGPNLTMTSAQSIAAVLTEIRQGRYKWVSMSRPDQSYAQTYLHDNGTWDVEHREDGPETHRTASTQNRASVEAFLWNWARNEPQDAWRTDFPFEPLEL